MVAKFSQPPYPGNADWRTWALQLVAYMQREAPVSQENPPTPILLQHMTGDERATQDGVVMFDRVLGVPVYSSGGAWYKFDGTPV